MIVIRSICLSAFRRTDFVVAVGIGFDAVVQQVALVVVGAQADLLDLQRLDHVLLAPNGVERRELLLVPPLL